MNSAVAITKTQEFRFTPEQTRMIRDSFLSGANEAEAAMLLEVARARRLNPITGQIHFVKRWNAERQREVWSYQVSIDGLRAIAERTGLRDGEDEAQYEYAETNGRRHLVKCTYRVYRKDCTRPYTGVAFYVEYLQKKKDGNATRMWGEKPHLMLAKCAEAAALRKAFPEDVGGLYVEEEMADELEAAPAQGVGRAEGLKAKLAARLPAATGAVEVTVERQEPQPAKASPPRRMPIRDVPSESQASEPPPPGDADAPPYLPYEAGETDAPEEPPLPPVERPVVMSFGTGKGRRLTELAKKDLAWYRKALEENLADPEKSRWASDNQTKLDAILREMERRQATANT